MGTAKAQEVMEIEAAMASFVNTSVDCNMYSFRDVGKTSLNNLFNQRQEYCRAYFDTNDDEIKRAAMDYFVRINEMISKALGITGKSEVISGGPISVEFNIPGMDKQLISGLPNVNSTTKVRCLNIECIYNVSHSCRSVHIKTAEDCKLHK